jgi:hypothetical protein
VGIAPRLMTAVVLPAAVAGCGSSTLSLAKITPDEASTLSQPSNKNGLHADDGKPSAAASCTACRSLAATMMRKRLQPVAAIESVASGTAEARHARTRSLGMPSRRIRPTRAATARVRSARAPVAGRLTGFAQRSRASSLMWCGTGCQDDVRGRRWRCCGRPRLEREHVLAL